MEVKARMPGKVDDVKVNVGDAVKKGDVLLIMEAMKKKTPMPAPQDGTVKEIKAAAGARVSAGDVLVIVE